MKKSNIFAGVKFSIGSCLPYLWLPILLFAIPEIALALPEGPNDLNALATKVTDQVQGSGLTIAMNAAGLGAVGYSVVSGFNKGPLVAGALLLAFANIYFPFVNSNFSAKDTAQHSSSN